MKEEHAMPPDENKTVSSDNIYSFLVKNIIVHACCVTELQLFDTLVVFVNTTLTNRGQTNESLEIRSYADYTVCSVTYC